MDFTPRRSTIGDILTAAAARQPEHPAAEDGAQRLTYRQLERRSGDMGRALLGSGVKKGDHIGVWAGNTCDTLALLYGIWRIGAVAVPLCTAFTARELGLCVHSADITLLFDGFHHGQLSLSGEAAVVPFTDPAETAAFLRRGEGVTEEALQKAGAQVSWSDHDTILFTSGTTGTALPVLTTHFSRVNTMYAQADMLSATADDRFCTVLPIYHCFSLTANVLAALAAGAEVVFPADRHSDTVLRTIEEKHCTILTAVPTLYRAVLREQRERPRDVSSLRTGVIGGAAYPAELFEDVCDTLGMALLSSLGQTEATAAVTATHPSDPLSLRRDTLGYFLPGTEGSIRSTDTNQPLPTGEVGEICLRGFNVMEGYYKRPRETARVIDTEGWLHTGDMGRMDDEGQLTYVGRLKELIIRGGENIVPRELETVLREDPRVDSVKVVGVPDPIFGEELCACVVRRSDTLSEEDVRTRIGQQLAAFKIPRYVVFLEALPYTAVGKVDLVALRHLAEGLTHGRE